MFFFEIRQVLVLLYWPEENLGFGWPGCSRNVNPCESNANYTCCILLHRTESRCLCEASPKILREFHLQPHWAPEGPNQWPAAVGHPGMACQDKFGWMPSTCGLTMDYNAQLQAKSSHLQIATQNATGLYQLEQIAVWWGCDRDPVSLRMANRTCRNML